MKGLVHVLGPRFVLPSIAATEFADRNKYAHSPDTAKMSEDERHHASKPAAKMTGMYYIGDPV